MHRKSFKNKFHVLLEVITCNFETERAYKTIFKNINSNEVEKVKLSIQK